MHLPVAPPCSAFLALLRLAKRRPTGGCSLALRLRALILPEQEKGFTLKRDDKLKFEYRHKNQAPRLGRPLFIDDARLAAAAVIVAAAAVIAVGNSVATATAVAEDQQQDDDPPPVVTAEATANTVIIAHKFYLQKFC